MKTTKTTAVVAISLLLSAAAVACSDRHERPEGEGSDTTEAEQPTRGSGSTLTIKGSDTMVILAQKWAEEFMHRNEGTTVQVSGGGSGTGIAALINGTTDLADASRLMKDREREQLREQRGADAKEFHVALDAVAVYVNDDNDVESLSLEELRKIYRGEVSNWNEVGGPDQAIVLYGRENSSGTYAFLKEHVLDDMDFAPQTQTLPGTAAVINAVSRDDGGIGYGGIAYAEGVRAIPLENEDGEAIEPTMENATSGRYPLSRYLNVYSAGEPEGIAKQYMDFILSGPGQEIIEGVGYYPLPTDDEAAGQGDEAPEGATGDET